MLIIGATSLEITPAALIGAHHVGLDEGLELVEGCAGVIRHESIKGAVHGLLAEELLPEDLPLEGARAIRKASRASIEINRSCLTVPRMGHPSDGQRNRAAARNVEL